MILIVHRKNFNYINIKHSTIQYIRIKLLTTSHGQNEMFETFSNKNKNWRNKKKNSQRNFNDGFPLGPRLFQIACEGTYVQNLFIPSETKEIKEGEKVSAETDGRNWRRYPVERGKQEENEATVAEKDDVSDGTRGKSSEKLGRRWLGDTWPEYLPVFPLPITAVARSTGAIHSLDVHTCHEAVSKRVAMEALNQTERRPPIMETFDSSASAVITGIPFTSDSLRMNVSWKLQPGVSVSIVNSMDAGRVR